MQEVINEKVSVIFSYNRETGLTMPKKLRWQGRDYSITRLSYHHCLKEGKALFHIFHVTDGHIDFRLRLNTDNLHWILEEIYDENIT
jgi:hypothetical protein